MRNLSLILVLAFVLSSFVFAKGGDFDKIVEKVEKECKESASIAEDCLNDVGQGKFGDAIGSCLEKYPKEFIECHKAHIDYIEADAKRLAEEIW